MLHEFPDRFHLPRGGGNGFLNISRYAIGSAVFVIADIPRNAGIIDLKNNAVRAHQSDQIPHGIGVEVVQMKTRDNQMIDIHTDIIVERENHKGIVVGKKGEMLKKIGSRARADIEALLGNPVNLQLWVKTRDNWRDSVNVLRDLGYDEKNDI